MLRFPVGLLLLACIAAAAQSEAVDADALDKQMDALIASGETLMQHWAEAKPSDVVPEVEEIQTSETGDEINTQYNAIFGHGDLSGKASDSAQMVAASAAFEEMKKRNAAKKLAKDKKKLAKAKALAAKQAKQNARKAAWAAKVATAKAKRAKAQEVQNGLDTLKELVGDKRVAAMGVGDVDIPSVPTKMPLTATEKKAAKKAAQDEEMKDGLKIANELLHPPKKAPKKADHAMPKAAGTTKKPLMAVEVTKPQVHSVLKGMVKQADGSWVRPKPMTRQAPPAAAVVGVPKKPTRIVHAATGVQVVSREKIMTTHGVRVLPPSVHLPSIHEYATPEQLAQSRRERMLDAKKKEQEQKKRELPPATSAAQQKRESSWTDAQWKAHFHAQAINNPIFRDAKVLGYFDHEDDAEEQDDDEDGKSPFETLMGDAGMAEFVRPEARALSKGDLVGGW